MKKYFIKICGTDNWTEVTKEKYIQVERGAGFRSKFGPNETATAYFSDGQVEGKVVYPGEKE
jgi:hypothetical protein